ncbi:MAG: UTP--glucose-1-phosphate uridylyltransferase [Firmicutes bacterium]|nr:UTP--glucose-1-phosphate uridylyltransferase [Bacillota bacterium]
MSKITKAVIPCGGLGTRFLPITKAVPKEILPIIDAPVLGHIVSEAIDSGITDILIVLGKGKDAIRAYFTPDKELEKRLRDAGRTENADMLEKIGQGARISFAVQEKPLGSGDAVLHAEKFACGEPFALAWGDDLIYSEDNPAMGQLISAYERCGANILGVQTILTNDIIKYGVADIGGGAPDGRIYPCVGIIEKPPLDKLPSRLAALGRYILTPRIFDVIRKTPTGKGDELFLTDALNILAQVGEVRVYDFIGKRYDMGDKYGSVLATVDYAVRNKVFGARFKTFLKDYVDGL